MAAITLPPNRTCKFPRIRLSRTVNKFINLSLSLSSLVRRIYLRELCLRTETTLRTEQRGIVLRLILLITLIKVDLSPYGGVSVRIDVSPTEWCISIFYVVPHIKQGLSSILVFFFLSCGMSLLVGLLPLARPVQGEGEVWNICWVLFIC